MAFFLITENILSVYMNRNDKDRIKYLNTYSLLTYAKSHSMLGGHIYM